MRVIGVDFGSVRIGIAVGDSEAGITTARGPLKPSGSLANDAAAIARIMRQEEALAVVVGIPLNDEDPRMAHVCRQLAVKLRELGLAVHEVDEALTSIEAERNLAAAGHKVKAIRDRRDGEAARLILERYFHEMA